MDNQPLATEERIHHHSQERIEGEVVAEHPVAVGVAEVGVLCTWLGHWYRTMAYLFVIPAGITHNAWRLLSQRLAVRFFSSALIELVSVPASAYYQLLPLGMNARMHACMLRGVCFTMAAHGHAASAGDLRMQCAQHLVCSHHTFLPLPLPLQVPVVVTEQERVVGTAHHEHHHAHHERIGEEVCGQKTFTEVEDRPVMRERVERIVEHRPVEKQVGESWAPVSQLDLPV